MSLQRTVHPQIATETCSCRGCGSYTNKQTRPMTISDRDGGDVVGGGMRSGERGCYDTILEVSIGCEMRSAQVHSMDCYREWSHIVHALVLVLVYSPDSVQEASSTITQSFYW
jgi:hypothetical protein